MIHEKAAERLSDKESLIVGENKLNKILHIDLKLEKRTCVKVHTDAFVHTTNVRKIIDQRLKKNRCSPCSTIRLSTP